MAENGTALVRRTLNGTPATAPFGGDSESFGTAQRIATALASSKLVPDAFKGDLASVLVAMEYANRLGCSVLAVMQHMANIHGKPSLSATFLIGTVNASGRFTPIRFRFQGTEGKDDWGCRAVAKDRETGEECVGPLVTIATAKAEGWYGRKGSKWATLPELMLHYRAASWWTRIFSPELSLGLHTTDESEDLYGRVEVPASRVQAAVAALDAPDEPAGPTLLRRHRDDARDANLLDADAEEQIEAALESGDPEAIEVWIDSLGGRLAELDGERVDP